MRPSGTKVDYRAALRRGYNARCLGRGQTLEVNLIQNERFHQLRLEDRSNHLYQGFIRKYQGTLGHRVNIAREPQVLQKIYEPRRKPFDSTQVTEVAGSEPEAAQELNYIRQTIYDNVVSIAGHLPERQFKHRDLVHVLGRVGLSHG